jgi:hypothetical protein
VRISLYPNTIFIAVLACSLSLLAGCATTDTQPPAQGVKERAMARWDALLGGDLAAAYEYLTPALRSSVSPIAYQRSILLQKVQWTGAKYIGESCEETVCKVTLSIDFVVRGALPGVRSFKDSDEIEETWLLVDGDWYYRPPQ